MNRFNCMFRVMHVANISQANIVRIIGIQIMNTSGIIRIHVIVYVDGTLFCTFIFIGVVFFFNNVVLFSLFPSWNTWPHIIKRMRFFTLPIDILNVACRCAWLSVWQIHFYIIFSKFYCSHGLSVLVHLHDHVSEQSCRQSYRV